MNKAHGRLIASVSDVNVFGCLNSVRLLVLKQKTQSSDVWFWTSLVWWSTFNIGHPSILG